MPLGKVFLMFNNNRSEDEIVQRFMDRCGYRPAQVLRTGGGILAGPIEELSQPAVPMELGTAEEGNTGQIALPVPQ